MDWNLGCTLHPIVPDKAKLSWRLPCYTDWSVHHDYMIEISKLIPLQKTDIYLANRAAWYQL